MEREILLFGPLRDRFEGRKMMIEGSNEQTVRSLLMGLKIEPEHVRIALDGVICDLDTELGSATEIAILPPVSGG